MIFRGYSWLFMQELHLEVFGGPYGMLRIAPGLVARKARQTPLHTVHHLAPISINHLKLTGLELSSTVPFNFLLLQNTCVHTLTYIANSYHL